MNLIARGLALALVAAWGIPLAVAQEKPVQEKKPPYKFVKDEATKYEVVGELRISLKGSHEDFIKNGEEPIKMNYKALFENVVLDVNAADGTARMERRVRTLSAEGMVEGMPFKYQWDRAKDAGKPAGPNEGPDKVAGLFRKWCVEPLQFTVTGEGKYDTKEDNYDQLVNKAGVMYWVVGTEAKPWLTEERIAAPLLHNKVLIEFKNELTRTRTVDGKKLLEITALPSLKGTIAPPPGVPAVAEGPVDFKVAADKSLVEFDTTNSRIHSVKLNLSITLSGHGPVSTGGQGDIRGDVKFTETQTFKK